MRSFGLAVLAPREGSKLTGRSLRGQDERVVFLGERSHHGGWNDRIQLMGSDIGDGYGGS